MTATVCLITGTTSGIGRETARALAADGHRLLMACRDETKARALKESLMAETGNDAIEVVRCEVEQRRDG